jgi:hypothetical protein
LASALTAGVAVAFSSLTGVGLLVASALGAALSSFFLANFISVLGASALAGADAAGAAGAAGVAGALAGSAANADAVTIEAIRVAIVFIGVSFKLMKM